MKTKTLLGTTLLLLVHLTSCSSKANVNNETTETRTISVCTEDDDLGETIKQTLDLKDFHAIKASTGIEIFYTPGKEYTVVFEDKEKYLKQHTFNVSNGMLTIKRKSVAATVGKRRNFQLHITAPNIDRLYNEGSMAFHATQWVAQSIDISNDGAFTLYANIHCYKNLHINNDGSFAFRQGSVKAYSVTVDNDGASTITVPFEVKQDLNMKNDGSSKLSGKIKASTYKEECDGAAKDSLDIEADNMWLNINGAGQGSFTFKGKIADIKGDGSSKLNLTVDCEQLRVKSDGSSRITVKGTADNTHFESDGVTKVDASELNNI